MTEPSPLYLTGPARRIAAVDDAPARHAQAHAAIVERVAELEQYRALYVEQYNTTLLAEDLEHRDPYLVELLAIRRLAAEEVAGNSDQRRQVFAAMADNLNRRRRPHPRA